MLAAPTITPSRFAMPPVIRMLALPAVLVAALDSPVIAHAATDRSMGLYVAKGMDTNLPEIPGRILEGDLRFDPTHLAAVSVLHLLPPPASWQPLFDRSGVPATRIGLEAVLAKHEGLQQHAEAAAAVTLRFGGWRIGMVRLHPMLGMGLSYAAGEPRYEDPPSRGDSDRRYRLQLFNVYELAWRLDDPQSRWEVITRIHHRSGLYGIVAPRGVGSNFLGIGLRRSF